MPVQTNSPRQVPARSIQYHWESGAQAQPASGFSQFAASQPYDELCRFSPWTSLHFHTTGKWYSPRVELRQMVSDPKKGTSG